MDIPEMKTFDHYILTRFNVNWLKNTRTDKNGIPVNSHEWLNQRIGLFEKYCYPSMINQTCQNFKWLIVFDPATPSDILSKYNRPKIFPIIYEGSDTFRNNIHSNADYIITSRLDNDDAYDPKFIETIQENFNEKEEIIDVFGVQYSLIDNKYYLPTNKKPSPFISLIEINKPKLDTVVKDQHGRMDQYYPYRKLKDRLYTIIIHDRNLLNRETKVEWKP